MRRTSPNYRRIVVLSLTHASLGNGLGIGMADFTTRRFADSYDPAVSYVNLLTASEPGGNTREGPMPLALDSDREAIEVALFSSLAGTARASAASRIRRCSTSSGSRKPCSDEVKPNPKLRDSAAAAPLPFDAAGNLF